jgi:mannose-6-phosphate isomerase
MWHILRAEPGAQVALGLKRQVTHSELRTSAESGAIAEQLNWLDVRAGDTYFVPAGTIHAIGAGIALCEIQQQSDITYRLYDYGRARELHLDQGVEVADLGPYVPSPQPPVSIAPCKYFCTVRLVIEGTGALEPDEARLRWLICIEGAGIIGGMRYRAGQAYQLDAATDAVPIRSSGVSVFLKTFVP